ncbi:MAG: DegT/DnrJ/EryC1/StrS family aminotransferase [Treponema sp.]|jgi:dTDP-4-amino-4,6-dideoxygalactose transaminase|nr:DegT/DnrJ/EryC1/StrS family aminotransferase [Treponema sp.]
MSDEKAPIPFARPFIGKEEEDAVLRVLRSGWLTTGQEALAFENEFTDFLNSPQRNFSSRTQITHLHCFAVNSATSGLHLALDACGIRRGDLVLVPSYTFTSTAEVIRYIGAEPVFVDVAPGGFHIDPNALEAALEKLSRNKGGVSGALKGQPAAIMPVHIGGLPCNMPAIMEIARRYNCKVIEDAAHSFPSLVSGAHGTADSCADPRFAGTIGDAGVFSFYATKTITTGEGGMVVCRDKKIADRIAIMRSHGIDRSVWNRYTDTKASWYYEVVEAGFKYNLPDILAALGRVQLSRAWDLLKMRQDIAARYNDAFINDRHFILPPSGSGNAWHLYPLRLRAETLAINRDEFIQKIQKAGIGVSVHFIPLHTMPYYKKTYRLRDEDFPESLTTFKQTISLPIWPGMTEAEVSRVIDVVKAAAEAYNKR